MTGPPSQPYLVPLDPSTLRAIPGVKVALHTPIMGPWASSPDGQLLALNNGNEVTLYTLSPLTNRGSIQVAPRAALHGPRSPAQRNGRADRIASTGWIDDMHLAVLVQHASPPYASRITRRTVVVVDPAQQRVVSRKVVPLRGWIASSATGGGRMLILTCRAAQSSLLIVSPSDSTILPVRAACRPSVRPIIAISPSGDQAAIVTGDRRVSLVDLASASIRTLRLRTAPGALDVPSPRSPQTQITLAATWSSPRDLAVTGSSLTQKLVIHRTDGRTTTTSPWSMRGLGVALLDPTRATARLITRNGSAVLATNGRLLVSGDGGAPRTGAGVTAYTPGGRRLWHVEGGSLAYPLVVGSRMFVDRFVKRHTMVDAFTLPGGRFERSLFARRTGPFVISGAQFPVGG
jgi:hypothetical protein